MPLNISPEFGKESSEKSTFRKAHDFKTVENSLTTNGSGGDDLPCSKDLILDKVRKCQRLPASSSSPFPKGLPTSTESARATNGRGFPPAKAFESNWSVARRRPAMG